MASFGWSYPPGAANDPSAPYNREPPYCRECSGLVAEEANEAGYPLCGAHDTPENRLAFDQLQWDERVGEEIHAIEVTEPDVPLAEIRDRAVGRVTERLGERPGGGGR